MLCLFYGTVLQCFVCHVSWYERPPITLRVVWKVINAKFYERIQLFICIVRILCRLHTLISHCSLACNVKVQSMSRAVWAVLVREGPLWFVSWNLLIKFVLLSYVLLLLVISREDGCDPGSWRLYFSLRVQQVKYYFILFAESHGVSFTREWIDSTPRPTVMWS